ncbi:MAG TPA: nucleotidyltransferase family protein [Streptosporangiaceae bacterium]|nr:nucleotidyltransferase family protein [Streptosporangiaceae bacterium]
MLTNELARAAVMARPAWYLVACCLYQTVWNVVTGQPAEVGILDYDLVYFDGADLSWEAADAVIRAGQKAFAGLATPMQIRNQAHGHLSYEQMCGRPCSPHGQRTTDVQVEDFEPRSDRPGLSHVWR